MKKLLKPIAIVAGAAYVVAALVLGTITYALEGQSTIIYNSDPSKRVPEILTVLFTMTAVSGSATFTSETTSTMLTNQIKGWYLDKVQIDGNHAGTEPTENSDFYLYDENGFDILGGAGVDQVDNTAEREVTPICGSVEKPQPITSALTLALSNNVVTNATCTFRLFFTAK